MTKKDYILTILNRLESYWPLAKPLAELVHNMDIDNEFINGLSSLLAQAIHDVNTSIEQEKLQQSHDILKKLQSQSQDEDSSTLDKELETMLQNI